MAKAIVLVRFAESGERNFEVSEEAIEKIKNVPTTYGIQTTAIVGPGRIGKSSLLNMIIGKNVFEIGSTTSRVTKGIWMYIDEDDVRKLAHIYIDVEGFGDPSKSNVDENDNQMLLIVIQICDVVLYNIRGVYDSDMRDKITLVCSLFQRYRKGNVVLEKPILVSISRDFDLDLPECPDTEFRNLFRKKPELLDTFRKTKAFTLFKPKEGKVGDLADTSDADLCKEFVQEKNEIKKYLTENTKPLRAAQNKIITGPVLAENIRRIVKHVKNDDLRMLSKSLTEIFKERNDVIMKAGLNTYKSEMRQKWPQPNQPETLMELHEREKNVALEKIDKNCFTIPESVDVNKLAFKNDTENIFKEMQGEECMKALKSATCGIEQNRKNDVYLEDGGEKRFLTDYDKAEKAYRECKNLGAEKLKLDIWQKYNEEMETFKRMVKQAALVIEKEKKDAISEKENEEMKEELIRERKKLDELTKEYKRSEKYDFVLRAAATLGHLFVDAGRGFTEMAANVVAANQQARPIEFRLCACPSGTKPSGGASSKSSSKGAKSSSQKTSSKDKKL